MQKVRDVCVGQLAQIKILKEIFSEARIFIWSTRASSLHCWYNIIHILYLKWLPGGKFLFWATATFPFLYCCAVSISFSQVPNTVPPFILSSGYKTIVDILQLFYFVFASKREQLRSPRLFPKTGNYFLSSHYSADLQ